MQLIPANRALLLPFLVSYVKGVVRIRSSGMALKMLNDMSKHLDVVPNKDKIMAAVQATEGSPENYMTDVRGQQAL